MCKSASRAAHVYLHFYRGTGTDAWLKTPYRCYPPRLAFSRPLTRTRVTKIVFSCSLKETTAWNRFSRVERKPFSFSAKSSGFLLMRSKQEKSSSSNSSLMRVPIGSEKAFRLHAAQNRYRLIPNFLHSLIVRVDTGLSPQRVPTLLVPTHLTLNWASRLNIYSHPTIKHPALIDYSIPHQHWRRLCAALLF